ncbi:beta-N-acetylglucosaminidase domain-containing protein [Spirillospora sp. CA-294931]|uniref:beta-N-acetylglucosaminidase domain-containing protein n=1 Tax=Spirillospora sp. CA-294931 TaxID=3240042 RepID=UPI003D8E9631
MAASPGLAVLSGPAAAAPLPQVWPMPQQQQARTDGFDLPETVGLVRATDADEAAARLVRSALTRAGVKEIKETGGADPGTPVTVWLGSGDPALDGLKVKNAEGLAAEGYVLAAGRAGKRAHIVLDGVDADGTYYAATSFQQVVRGRRVPGVAIRDWPSMRYRGLIEGFYGTPWSHEGRLDLIDYLGAHKMNTFEYAPKDDPYHREKWREPYPADKLAQLGELVGRAKANRVDFTFALSPGLSICYSSDADLKALTDKFESMYALGVRSFNVPFDDIDYGKWNCEADPARFGTGGAGAGKAQAHVLNKVQAWVRSKGDVAKLQMVPTEYYNVTETGYKKALRDELDPEVIVHWTGIGVIPTTITKEQAAEARRVFGHEILVWDNYPVNDYIPGRLPLADFSGRENGISQHLAGLISNPANQAAVSKIGLFSAADLAWNNTAYDARRSWLAALDERAGGDRKTAAALRTFADLNTYDGTLHKRQSPELAEAAAAFWRLWNAGDHDGAIDGLKDDARAVTTAPARIRTGVTDPKFAAEARVWLEATELWGRALTAALDMLAAQAAGDGAGAWKQRRLIDPLVAKARALRDTTEPHSRSAPRIGDGVLDRFIDDAKAANNAWLGIPGAAKATSSMGTHADNEPSRMIDGDPSTYYYSNGAPAAGDHFGVDLGSPREIGDIAVLMTKPGSPNDYLKSGTLEYSSDGTSWTALAQGSTPEVRATAPAGTRARYVRYRATAANQGFWVVVREFSVQTRDGATFTVTGTPAPAQGSALRSAADGDADSVYAAGSAPRPGDALVVTAAASRPVREVTVLQHEPAARAEVQVRTDGVWRTVGTLRAAHARFPVGESVDAVRLLWTSGSPAPAIAEVIVR